MQNAAKNINAQVTRSVLFKCAVNDKSDFDFLRCHQIDKMSRSIIFLKKCLGPAFLSKIWALEKWCVTKVVHCMNNCEHMHTQTQKFRNRIYDAFFLNITTTDIILFFFFYENKVLFLTIRNHYRKLHFIHLT